MHSLSYGAGRESIPSVLGTQLAPFVARTEQRGGDIACSDYCRGTSFRLKKGENKGVRRSLLV